MNKVVLKIGKPTHFRPTNANISACGVVSPEYAAYDGRSSDCLRCKTTTKYKIYMGINVQKDRKKAL